MESIIKEYSKQNGYEATHFAESICKNCQNSEFRLLINADEGVVVRLCNNCDSEHGMGDSDEYFDEVEEVFPIECDCGANVFKVMSGVSLYSNSNDVRWYYLALDCVKCGDKAVYADWKNEFNDYRKFLSNV